MTSTLWALPVIDGKPQGAAVRVYEDVTGSTLGLTSRGALYYQKRTTGSEIHLAAIDFAREKILTPRTLPLVAPGQAPAWSSDGSQLAHFRQGRELTIRSHDTGRARMIRVWGLNPRWSPDGRSFLLSRRRSSKESQLIRLDAASGSETVLVSSDRGPDELIDNALWASDGERVYFRKIVG